MTSALTWFYHHDPIKTMKTTRNVAGLPKPLSIQVTAALSGNRFPWEEMEIQVDPYSLPAATPQSRLSDLQQVMSTIIIPLAQQLAAQGVVPDMQAYLGKIAKYLNMPDLQEIITYADPAQSSAATGTSGSTSSRAAAWADNAELCAAFARFGDERRQGLGSGERHEAKRSGCKVTESLDEAHRETESGPRYEMDDGSLITRRRV